MVDCARHCFNIAYFLSTNEEATARLERQINVVGAKLLDSNISDWQGLSVFA